MIPAQLQQALSLSLYLFIITMFLSYEYHKKLKATGIAEAAAATPEGKNGQPFCTGGCECDSVVFRLVLQRFVARSSMELYLFWDVSFRTHFDG